MRGAARNVYYLVCVGGFFAAVFSLDAMTADGKLQAWLGLGLSVALGFMLGRIWALGVPIAVALVLLVYGAVVPDTPCATCEEASSHLSPSCS